MTATTDYGHYNPRTGAFVHGHGPNGTLMVLTVIVGLTCYIGYLFPLNFNPVVSG